MAITTTNILPFVIAKRGGKLGPGTSQQAEDRAKTLAAVAERMVGQVVGVVVPEEQSYPAQDIFAGPRLVCPVPNEKTESLAA